VCKRAGIATETAPLFDVCFEKVQRRFGFAISHKLLSEIALPN
jgi:hypothetical protein